MDANLAARNAEFTAKVGQEHPAHMPAMQLCPSFHVHKARTHGYWQEAYFTAWQDRNTWR